MFLMSLAYRCFCRCTRIISCTGISVYFVLRQWNRMRNIVAGYQRSMPTRLLLITKEFRLHITFLAVDHSFPVVHHPSE